MDIISLLLSGAVGFAIGASSKKSGSIFIIKKLNKMSEQFDQLKAKVEAQSTALDNIDTNISGIAGDVATLKAKITELENGATPAQVAELSALVDGVDTKITAIGNTTAALDAETPEATTEG